MEQKKECEKMEMMEMKEFEGEWWVKAEDVFKKLKKMNEDEK